MLAITEIYISDLKCVGSWWLKLAAAGQSVEWKFGIADVILSPLGPRTLWLLVAASDRGRL